MPKLYRLGMYCEYQQMIYEAGMNRVEITAVTMIIAMVLSFDSMRGLIVLE
jgi:hypothetical protein